MTRLHIDNTKVNTMQEGTSGGSSADGMKLRIELGRAWLAAEEVSHLTVGSVVELTCESDADVDVLAAGKLAARGKLVMVDNRLGVRVARVEGNTQRGG